MKYMLLMHQGAAPTPRSPDEWASLSEDEQKAICADYQSINETPGVSPGPPAGLSRNGNHGAGTGRQDADHRQPVRRDRGVDRRLPLCSRPKTSTPRSSWPRGSRRHAWAARSRCVRSWSGSESSSRSSATSGDVFPLR